MIDLEYHNKGKRVVGIDEAGRGCIAGSMFIAAVSFDFGFLEEINAIGLRDSKKLTSKKRFRLEEEIRKYSVSKIVSVSAEDINSGKNLNILSDIEAKKIYDEFGCCIYLFDGNRKISTIPEDIQYIEPKLDDKSLSVSAASILAKNAQVNFMIELDSRLPEYYFSKHKGYGTKQHYEMIRKFGVTEEHRKHWIK